MTNAKSTKRALLASVISMLLCAAMLIGTTFAWFTDSVTTGRNTIQAGNLDVELQYSTDGTNWYDVTETTNMFTDGALWEPGYTEVVYLKVVNAGSLALKYQFGINVVSKTIGYTADDKEIDLSNYIKFGVVDVSAAYEKRDDARDEVEDAAVLISAGYLSEEGNLEADEESGMIAMVVYMPEEVGNEANHGPDSGDVPSINLGISLVATQYTYEKDSYGDDYDAEAAYPTLVLVSSADELGNAISTAEDGDVIALTDDVELSGPLTVSADITIEGNGNAIVTYPVYVSARNTVTFSNVSFENTTGTETASSVYGSGFSGTIVFDGCSFGDSNWESIQITPKGDAEIVIRNCTFTAQKDMKRFIHIQPGGDNDCKLDITIENCTFEGCDKVNYSTSDTLSVIDLDYIDAGSTMTLGGCTFTNTDGSVCTGAHAYFCQNADGGYDETYDYDAMYDMLTGEVQTYTVE